MADIALRVYLEDIDGMIDGNRVDEAIAHLKHILGIYPKNLEAYRLLAKALLEKNRHLDAADVFQRVLSSVPDDFISHIGMAVVREDEGNLDAAIWHMERAYEVQPSNGPVQEELRRLYGKRDGAEPPRLRLSRAALARMYEKGDLYPQAIAELRVALGEDPERLDLKVMLAAALWRAKQRPEAAEASARVIEVLPYCREANRILADVWHESGRKNEAQGYRRRLEALDPYEAYADPSQNGDGVLTVPPENVRIPRLETPYGEGGFGPADANRPDWMEALGIEYDQPAAAAPTAESPDWLNNIGISAEATVPGEPGGAPAAEGGDWLSALRGDSGAEQTAPATAEIPDWFQSPAEGQPSQAEASDWMAGFGTTAGAAAGGEDWLRMLDETGEQQPAAEQPAQAAESESADMPSWMTEDVSASRPALPRDTGKAGPGMTAFLTAMGETPTAEPPPPTASAEAGVPDWLRADLAETAVPATARDEASDWFTAGEAAVAAIPAEAEIPDWLRGSAVEEEQPASPTPAAEIPDWLKSSEPLATTPTATTQAEVPDWLTGSAPEEAVAPAAAAEVPDWLRASEPAAPAETEVPDWLTPGAPVSAVPAAPAAELPDWLKTPEAPVEAASAEAEAPDWLSASAAKEPAIPAADIPDWLKAPEPSAPVAVTKTGVTDWLEKVAPAAPTAPVEEEAEIPDWLKPSEPAAQVPTAKTGVTDWLTKSAPPPVVPTAAQLAPEDVPAWLRPSEPVEASAEALPDWLKPGDEEQPIAPEEKEKIMAHAAEEIPDWMAAAGWVPRDPSIPLDQAGAIAAEEEVVAPPEPAEMPEWLQSLKPPEEPHPAVAASGEAPEWLRQAMEGKPGEQPKAAAPAAKPEAVVPERAAAASAAKPAPSDMSADEALAWLEELAQKQGAKEEELVTKRTSEVPDWIRKPPTEEEAPEAPQAPAEPEAALPDWLRTPAEVESARAAATTPEWLRAPAEAEQLPAAPEPAMVVPPPSEDAALAWLEALAAKQGAKPEELVTKPEAREQVETPTWLRAPAPETAEPQPTPQAEASAPSEVTPSEDEALAWLDSLAAKQGAKPEELATKPEARVDELPAWVRESHPPVPAPTTEPEPAAAEAEPAPTISEVGKPEWLKQMEAEADQYEAMTKAQPEPAKPAEVSVPSSEDEALAWLESLAAKQGAKPEELVTKPEVRAEAIPAWVREAQEAPVPPTPEPVKTELEPAIAEAEKPEWLKQMEAEADQYEATAKAKPAPAEPAPTLKPEELPAWLAAAPEPGEAAAEWMPKASDAAEPRHVPPEAESLPAWLAAVPEPGEPEAPAWVPIASAEPAGPVAEAARPPSTLKRPKPAKPKAPRKRPARPSKLRSSEEPEIVLALARQRLAENNFGESFDVYSELIHSGGILEDIIADLEAANQKNPGMPELLRTLGDAYMRNNQLRRALDTYKQALRQL